MSNIPEWYQEPSDPEEQDKKEERAEEEANADYGNEIDTI